MRLLKARKEDAKEILDLRHLAYQSEAQLLGDLSIGPLRGIAIKAAAGDGRVIGSARAFLEVETAFIGKLTVHPAYRRRGLGAKLLAEIEAACD